MQYKKKMPFDAGKQTKGLMKGVKTPMQIHNNTSAILIKANKNPKPVGRNSKQ